MTPDDSHRMDLISNIKSPNTRKSRKSPKIDRVNSGKSFTKAFEADGIKF